ncbi:NINE protein [uncultured Dokdonia sp.]|uniref:NINE protein n=1 Tax=uncultured Dokdonia sp. TaxID=575653 RepID=UPI00261D7AA0|nr:NINE protein [uncultured Dokdonia sp.]
MSEETNQGQGDDLKDKAKKMADEASEKASEFADDVKDSAKDFSDSAKEEWNKVTNSTDNKKMLAGLLAIFVGWLGVHKFVLGYQKEGIIMLVISIIGIVLSCIGIGIFVVWAMGLVGLIEGIMYLTKSDEEFYNTYQVGKKPWF